MEDTLTHFSTQDVIKSAVVLLREIPTCLLQILAPIPGPDKPSGPYPTIVLNKSGDKVLVVQASAYTKYLGNLTVFFDNFANVVGWDGAPIFLDDNNIHSGNLVSGLFQIAKDTVNMHITLSLKNCAKDR